MPVRVYMERLGSKFRFFVRYHVQRATASALNIARSVTDPSAAFTAVVDADYQVVPDFLSIAVSRCAEADSV
jgi:hypothetical protein